MSSTESSTPAAEPIPLTFPTDSDVATAFGRLHGYDDTVEYSVDANSGQQMIVNILAHNPPGTVEGFVTAGQVFFPQGGQTGGPGGIIMDSTLDQSGTYVIQVMNNSTVSSVPSGDFTLEVTLA
jgi:hypothetical protein